MMVFYLLRPDRVNRDGMLLKMIEAKSLQPERPSDLLSLLTLSLSLTIFFVFRFIDFETTTDLKPG